MKKLLFSLLFSSVLASAFGQAIQYTSGVPHTAGTPTSTPTTYGSWLRYDKTNKVLYRWTGSAWAAIVAVVADGDKGDVTVSSSGVNWQIDATAVGNTEIASGAGGIFKSSGIVPDNTTATVTDEFTITRSDNTFYIDENEVRIGDILSENLVGHDLTTGEVYIRSGLAKFSVLGTALEIEMQNGSTGNIDIQNGAGDFTITDARATKNGLEYAADYSAGFSARSLVDKAYVDAAGPAGTISVHTYTTAQTATSLSVPSNATSVEIEVGGAGAGGGSGRRGAAGTNRCGGGGGASGAVSYKVFPISDFSGATTIEITVGTGGAGAAAAGADNTNGATGTAGGESYVEVSGSKIIRATGGSAGAGGAAGGATAGGAAATTGDFVGLAGSNANATGGPGTTSTSATTRVSSGGSAGGGVNTANVGFSGGTTGSAYYGVIAGVSASATAGTDGTDGTLGRHAGSGGGGGGGNASTAGYNGGVGGAPCGGGGGGGGVLNGNASGAGGAGADGFVRVIFR